MKKRKRSQKIRNWIAVAAHNRGGAGAHGGSSQQKNRRDRRHEKQRLRDADYEAYKHGLIEEVQRACEYLLGPQFGSAADVEERAVRMVRDVVGEHAHVSAWVRGAQIDVSVSIPYWEAHAAVVNDTVPVTLTVQTLPG